MCKWVGSDTEMYKRIRSDTGVCKWVGGGYRGEQVGRGGYRGLQVNTSG